MLKIGTITKYGETNDLYTYLDYNGNRLYRAGISGDTYEEETFDEKVKDGTFEVAITQENYKHLLQVGFGKTGHTYFLNRKDLYVYQQKPNGDWNGWLCNWAAWPTFAKGMSWAITEITA